MRTLIAILMLVVCLPGLVRPADNKLPPVNFDQDTLSLPPAYFPEMPPQLRIWLEQRQYRIPQVHDLYMYLADGLEKQNRYNVVTGNFDGSGNDDWLFATFRKDTLKVFVCWNADTTAIEQLEISEFDRYPDVYNVETMESEKYPRGYGSIGFRDRDVLSFEIIIDFVAEEWLNKDRNPGFNNLYGDTTTLPDSFAHDGIVLRSGRDSWDGGFFRYWYQNKWIRFH